MIYTFLNTSQRPKKTRYTYYGKESQMGGFIYKIPNFKVPVKITFYTCLIKLLTYLKH